MFMLRRYLFLLCLCFSPLSSAASDPSRTLAGDLYLGEAFYYATQGEYFDAITQLDTRLKQFHRLDNPKIDPLHIKIKNAKFTIGDFEMAYRMPLRAIKSVRELLEGNIDQSIRNETNYRLARFHQMNNNPSGALGYIENISGRVPSDIREDELFLRAQVYMVTGNADRAIKTLKKLQGSDRYEGFESYNLGIALMLNGQELEGIEQLDKTGQIMSDNEGALAIKDKANLTLGNRLIAAEQPALAKQYLDRVRVNGPFSNTALLGSGMADVTLGKFERALVPWSILQKRDASDRAVQESLLGVPFAYSRLELHGRAALLYGTALESFATEQGNLEASIKNIREGKLLKTLLRIEAKQNKNWLVKLKEFPRTPETHYLMELLASNDFQDSLRNYLDLAELLKKLEPWNGDLEAYEAIIQNRQQHFETILPAFDKQLLAIDGQMRLLLDKKLALDEHLSGMSNSAQPELLETSEEAKTRANLKHLEQQYQNDRSTAAVEARQRLAKEQEKLQQKINSSYNKRLDEAIQRNRQLDDEMEKLKNQYSSLDLSRQAAIQSYKGYSTQIYQLKRRILSSRGKVQTLLEKQGHILEVMAINELEQRRKKLQEYQMLARFSISESYDRASKKQIEESAKK